VIQGIGVPFPHRVGRGLRGWGVIQGIGVPFPHRVGRGLRGWGVIQWIILIDRGGVADGPAKLDSVVMKSAFVDT